MELTPGRAYRPSFLEFSIPSALKVAVPRQSCEANRQRYGKDAHPPGRRQHPCQGSGGCDAEPFGLIARHERHDRAEQAEEQCQPDAGPSCLNPHSNEPFVGGCHRKGPCLGWFIGHGLRA